MIRVLQITGTLAMGGVETFVMNVYRRIDRSKIQFDFLIFREEPQYYEEEALALGARVFRLPGRRRGILKSRAALRRFFQEHRGEYAAAHYHTESASYLAPLSEAKKAGINKRIVHSHNTRAGTKISRILHYLQAHKIYSNATDYLACGEKAADWLYQDKRCREKAVVIYNGLDLQKYRFDASIRALTRRELNVADDMIAYGHIGAFREQKNHRFLIDVFYELKKKKANSVLLLAGDGALRSEIEAKVKELGLSQDVVFLGNRNDVHRLLQAMDVFVFPSLYEGFPIVAVEAAAAGIPSYLSATITREALLNENMRTISLERSPAEWAEEISNVKMERRHSDAVADAGFDLQTAVDYLSELYA